MKTSSVVKCGRGNAKEVRRASAKDFYSKQRRARPKSLIGRVLGRLLCFSPLYFRFLLPDMENYQRLFSSRGRGNVWQAERRLRNAARQLESWSHNSYSAILQAHQDIHRTGDKVMGNGTNSATSEGSARRSPPSNISTAKRGEPVMSVATLKENYYWHAPFIVPRTWKVTVDMEAGGPVDMYILLNDYELSAFKQGARPIHRSAQGIQIFNNKVNLAALQPSVVPPQPPQTTSPTLASTALASLLSSPPIISGPPLPGSTWYLIIANRPGNKDIPIFYRVYNA